MADYAVFVLTYGRPDNVKTYNMLRESGYTGKIFLVCSSDDKRLSEYQAKYEDVIVFNKREIELEIDTADNFKNYASVLYARNACFRIAEQLGYEYFIELDDDYGSIVYTVDHNYHWTSSSMKADRVKKLDEIFDLTFEYFKSGPFATLAYSQSGDWLGGGDKPHTMFDKLGARRKAMQIFFCSVKRPFDFIGTLNDDVNAYVKHGRTGKLFMTYPYLCVQQMQTQSNAGGLTEIYKAMGTYAKSFYTVMLSPSSVRVFAMQTSNTRLHHIIKWDRTVPMIIRESHRKVDKVGA
jgi:hypothetical protein